MPGQFKDIAFNIGVVVQVVVIVVVPVVLSLLTLHFVRRLRMTARGFEVQPVSATPHNPWYECPMTKELTPPVILSAAKDLPSIARPVQELWSVPAWK